MVLELLEAERFRRQRVWQDMEDLNILERVWEGSARWVHQKWTNFFLKFKFAVLRFGIAKVEVQGGKWKIDCSGYLLENGKGMWANVLCRVLLIREQLSIASFPKSRAALCPGFMTPRECLLHWHTTVNIVSKCNI
jgi:hypothetical protein